MTVVDDLDGSPNASATTFGLDGRAYDIDLSPANRAKLDGILAPFIAAARRARPGRVPARSNGYAAVAAARRRPAPNREQNQAIRDWAKRQGMDVSDRGRIPAEIVDAYNEAHRPEATQRPGVNGTPVATETTAAAVPAQRADTTTADAPITTYATRAERNKAIRAWAGPAGVNVAPRGAISDDVLAKFEAANGPTAIEQQDA
ncbi:hypothetical protein PSD17_39380 [Pseudonocardia sp. D17]|nr:hypothetical protein PSD17_39380 [Pseudonocardia sp. D17]